RYRVLDARPPAATTAAMRTFLQKPPGPAALAEVPQAEALPEKLSKSLRQALATQQPDRSDHTWHVACAGYRAGLSAGQVVALLEMDEVTQERWNGKAGLRDRELPGLLAEANLLAGPPATTKSPPAPLLPDEFWETRSHPFLAQIRQAALFKMRSPDSILHA